MYSKVVFNIGRLIRKTGNYIISLSQKENVVNNSKIKIFGNERNLYKTRFNDLFWLNQSGYIDQCIIKDGTFEEVSSQLVKQIVRKGDFVLDVGANIGYYSVICSKLVGNKGKIFCIEPTKHYYNILNMNLEANELNNVLVYNIGLSNKEDQLEIKIGDSSATLHSPGTELILNTELIELTTLDAFIERNRIERINFIKIDIDGHEPFFFEGAKKFFKTNKPIMMVEFSNQSLYLAGTDVLNLKKQIEMFGYVLYSEKTKREFNNIMEFLIECGNFQISANVWALPIDLATKINTLEELKDYNFNRT